MRSMNRLLHYCAFALCMAVTSAFAIGVERPVMFLVDSFRGMGELTAASAERFRMTLIGWGAGSQANEGMSTASLRASSNHFVIADANLPPDGEVGWVAV